MESLKALKSCALLSAFILVDASPENTFQPTENAEFVTMVFILSLLQKRLHAALPAISMDNAMEAISLRRLQDTNELVWRLTRLGNARIQMRA
jgi:hypothetical protein